MKKTKFLAFLLCCFSAFLFASCLDDDGGKTGLTNEEARQCLNSIRGSYSGDLIYESQNPIIATDKTDTLDIDWQVNAADTTLVVYSFPAKLIAKDLPEGDVKTALSQASGATLKAKIGFYQITPVIGYILFLCLWFIMSSMVEVPTRFQPTSVLMAIPLVCIRLLKRLCRCSSYLAEFISTTISIQTY